MMQQCSVQELVYNSFNLYTNSCMRGRAEGDGCMQPSSMSVTFVHIANVGAQGQDALHIPSGSSFWPSRQERIFARLALLYTKQGEVFKMRFMNGNSSNTFWADLAEFFLCGWLSVSCLFRV